MTNIDEENLLAKLDELNRSLQMDSKSVQSLNFLIRNDSLTSEYNCIYTIDDDKISVSSVTGASPSIDVHSRVMEKWINVINKWHPSTRMRSQVRELIKQGRGIPHHFRPLVWQLLCGSHDENSLMNQMRILYPDYLKKQSPFENAIRRDITRTYPQHDLFKKPNCDGQERLFNIMKAYSIHDREVGYCQGSGFIGGLLLIQMPEEDAFAVLISLLFEHHLRNLYKPNMDELGLCMYQLDCLVEEHLPKLALHFRSHNFHATVYASGWFLTLFTLSFSIDLASRVMDLFIVEGFEIIYKISLAYLTMFQDELLKMEMESMLRFLQSSGPKILDEDPNNLFDLALHIKLNTRKMKKTEKEYLVLKAEEEVHQVELRRLRSENGLLLQRIHHLEKEIEELNQDLALRNISFNDNTQEISILKYNICESNQKVEILCRKLSATEIKLTSALEQLNDLKSRENTKEVMAGHPCNNVSSYLGEESQYHLVNNGLGEATWNSTSGNRDKKESGVICRISNNDDQVSIDLLFQDVDESIRNVGEKEFVSDLESVKLKVMELEEKQHINCMEILRRDEEIYLLKMKCGENQIIQNYLTLDLKEAQGRFEDMKTKSEKDVRMWNTQKMELESVVAELQESIALMDNPKERNPSLPVVESEVVYGVNAAMQRESAPEAKKVPFSDQSEPHTVITESCSPPQQRHDSPNEFGDLVLAMGHGRSSPEDSDIDSPK